MDFLDPVSNEDIQRFWTQGLASHPALKNVSDSKKDKICKNLLR